MKLIVAKRLVLFALIWLVLTRADVSGFAFGIVVAAGSTWVSLILLPPGSHRVSIAGMIRLAPGFLRSSLLGGIDVARRALHPRMPLDAGWIAYRTKLPRGLPRVSFGSKTSLLPGSLVAGGRGDVLYVHCLDRGQDVERSLRDEEERIASTLTEGDRREERGP